MQFQITDKLIRSISKETSETTEKRIIISSFYFTNKFLYFKLRLYRIGVCIKRKQEFDKPFLYFAIRETQAINAKTLFISFDSEITALINDRNGIVRC